MARDVGGVASGEAFTRTSWSPLSWFNSRSLTSDKLETLFGRLAQLLHYKPFTRAVLRMLARIQYLTRVSIMPAQDRGFWCPVSQAHKRHFSLAEAASWSSGAADQLGSSLYQRYTAAKRVMAARFSNQIPSIRSLFKNGRHAD